MTARSIVETIVDDVAAPRYALAVGARWSNAEGRLQRLPVLLTPAEIIAAVVLAGFDAAAIVPAALVDAAKDKALRTRPRTVLVLTELEPTPLKVADEEEDLS